MPLNPLPFVRFPSHAHKQELAGRVPLVCGARKGLGRLYRGVRRRLRIPCSRQAAYITGRNLLIDGSSYPSTFYQAANEERRMTFQLKEITLWKRFIQQPKVPLQ